MTFNPQSNLLGRDPVFASSSPMERMMGGMRRSAFILCFGAGACLFLWMYREHQKMTKEADATSPAMVVEAEGAAGGSDASSSFRSHAGESMAWREAPSSNERAKVGGQDVAPADGADTERIRSAAGAIADGKRQLMMRRYIEAASYFERAIELDSESIEAHYNLGMAYAQMNRTRAAAAEVRWLESRDANLASLLRSLLRTRTGGARANNWRN